MTMDRYLDGALGYGLIGYKSTPEYPDTSNSHYGQKSGETVETVGPQRGRGSPN